jgi:polyisoprenoid-binding protein YceI
MTKILRFLALPPTLAGLLPAATWQIDTAHSSAQFAVRHLMVSTVRGEFGGVKGKAEYDPGNLANAKLDVTIDVASVNTREPKRDAHLKSADFFDVANFPLMEFHSKKFERAGQGKLRIAGALTIRGVTREATIDVEGPSAELKEAGGRRRIGAAGSLKISRKDFGMTWNRVLEAGGVSVSDEVAITLDVELLSGGQ